MARIAVIALCVVVLAPAAAGAQNACFASSGALAFSCDKYQPMIVNATLSYGFAGHGNTATATCCQCFQFTWTSGAAAGKSMIVQAINAGGITDTDFDIYVRHGCGRHRRMRGCGVHRMARHPAEVWVITTPARHNTARPPVDGAVSMEVGISWFSTYSFSDLIRP